MARHLLVKEHHILGRPGIGISDHSVDDSGSAMRRKQGEHGQRRQAPPNGATPRLTPHPRHILRTPWTQMRQGLRSWSPLDGRATRTLTGGVHWVASVGHNPTGTSPPRTGVSGFLGETQDPRVVRHSKEDRDSILTGPRSFPNGWQKGN